MEPIFTFRCTLALLLGAFAGAKVLRLLRASQVKAPRVTIVAETPQVEEAIETLAAQAVEAPVPLPAPRWMVNNGTRICGPYEPHEIAELLYAQELDFDCECYLENVKDDGRPQAIAQTIAQTIATSGMFGDLTDDVSAAVWVFDNGNLHGPLSTQVVEISNRFGAFSSSAFVCQGSALNGWKPIRSSLAS